MDTLKRKELWHWVLDIVVWLACVYALVWVLKEAGDKLSLLDPSLWPEWVSKHN